MLDYTGPWIDFPLPSEAILPEDLSEQLLKENPHLYAKYLLIIRLREFADYTEPLPSLTSCRTTDSLKGKLQVLHKTTDPNYYLSNGVSVIDSYLLSGIQIYNLEQLQKDELPPIMFQVEGLKNTNKIFDIIPENNTADILPLTHWVCKTKMLDSDTRSLSKLGYAIYENEETRSLIFSYGLNTDELTDLEAIEEARKRVMYRSEKDYFTAVMFDRIGFFGALNIVNPNYITDNRAAFNPNNLPDYINSVGQRDYINFRLKIVQVNSIDYFMVQWRFPQQENAKRLSGTTAFNSDDLLKLYGKV
jgi:hypothetical protein